jgi:hypothetical protein
MRNAKPLWSPAVRWILALALFPAAGIVQGADTSAQSACRLYSETGRQVCGLFLRYWDEHGGLAQQGFPISEVMQERSDTDGKTYTVQYFERADFEHHPENRGTDYEVLLAFLGRQYYSERYGTTVPIQHPNTSEGSILFSQTGKRLGGWFLDYWQKNGGLAQQGFPITDELLERSPLNGSKYIVQYFERAVFEFHPENAGTEHQVLLSHLGTFRYNAKHRAADAWNGLRVRPLTLPRIAPGAPCPAEAGRRVAPQFGEAFGEGPLYPVLGSGTKPDYYLSAASEEGGWYLLKTLWVAPPDFKGPALIRGRQLDGTGELRFGQGASPAPELPLAAPASAASQAQQWSDWPSYSRVRGPGCYGFQIDTVGASRSVVFRVLSDAP